MKQSRFFWLSIIVAVLSACAGKSPPPKPDPVELELREFRRTIANQKYAQGVSLFKEGRMQEAAAMFETAVDRDPNFAAAHNKLGEISLKQKDQEKAEFYFKAAVAGQPDFLPVYHNLGNLYNDQGKHQQAEEIYNKSLNISAMQDQPFSLAYYGLGRVLLGYNKPEAALEKFNQAVALEPYQAVFHKGLGDAYQAMGDNEHAIAAYDKALQIDPRFFDVYYLLGRCYHAQGSYDKAAGSYWKAIRYNYNNAQVQEWLGLAYLAQNNYDLAAITFQQALTLDPKYANAWYRLGQAAHKQNDFRQAEQALKKALDLQPGHAAAWLELGDVYRRQNKTQEAVSAYEKAVKYDAKLLAAYFSLGEIYRSLRLWDRALAAYTRALDIAPQNAAAYYGLGQSYRDQSYYPKAVGAMQKALEIDPRYLAARYSLGSIYHLMDEPAKARRYQEEALLELLKKRGVSEEDARQKMADPLFCFKLAAEIVPNDPQIYTQLGTIHMTNGNYAEAAQAYSKAANMESIDWESFERWAIAASAAGNMAEAETAYKRAIGLYPQNADAYYNLGLIYWRQEKLDEALENLQRALETQGRGQANAGDQLGKIAQINLYLGQVLLTKGVKSRRRDWVEQASQHLRACLKFDPAQTQVQALLTQAENLLANKIQVVWAQVKKLKTAHELRDQFFSYGPSPRIEPLLKQYPKECRILYAGPEDLGPQLWSSLQQLRDGHVSDVLNNGDTYHVLYRIQSL